MRWHLATALVGGTALVAWVAAGTPWPPPVVAVVAALAVRSLRRLLPRTLRRPGAIGILGGAVTLVPELSLPAGLLAVATLLVAVALVGGGRLAGHRRANRGWLCGPSRVPLGFTGGFLGSAPGRGLAGGLVRDPVRLLLAVGLVLAVVGTVGLVVQAGNTRRAQAAQAAQISAFHRAQLLPSSPARAAGLLLGAVAHNDPTVCTATLDRRAGEQLATAAHAADCPTAIRALAAQVIDPRLYSRPDSDAIPTTSSGDGQLATADLCRLTWNGITAVLTGATATTTANGQPPGPQLGRLDLTRILGQGYQITRFTSC